MPNVVHLYFDQLIVFVLVLSRVSGLVLTAPMLGSKAWPVHIRALFTVALAALVAPLYWHSSPDRPQNVPQLAMLMITEIVVGIVLGLGIQILLSGFQLAGNIAGQMSGMALADTFSANSEENVSVFAQLIDLVSLAVFLLIGGHRMLMTGLLDTFKAMPPGEAFITSAMPEATLELLTQSFILGIRASAPTMLALLMATLIVGLIGRTMPQLNVMAIGFSVNTVIMLGTLALSLGAITYLLQEELEPAIQLLLESLRGAPMK